MIQPHTTCLSLRCCHLVNGRCAVNMCHDVRKLYWGAVKFRELIPEEPAIVLEPNGRIVKPGEVEELAKRRQYRSGDAGHAPGGRSEGV